MLSCEGDRREQVWERNSGRACVGVSGCWLGLVGMWDWVLEGHWAQVRQDGAPSLWAVIYCGCEGEGFIWWLSSAGGEVQVRMCGEEPQWVSASARGRR